MDLGEIPTFRAAHDAERHRSGGFERGLRVEVVEGKANRHYLHYS